jgi:hypothetical protein
MVRCILCGKELKTERGLSVHLARTHDVHGIHGRISLKIVKEFFPLLEKKRWTKAKKLLKHVKQDTDDSDEWISGYIHALTGMIVALKWSTSTPQPFIVGIGDFSDKKLKESKTMFDDLSVTLKDKDEFDTAYFQAWKDFTQYVLQTRD